MTFDIIKLKAIMDSVRNDPSLVPVRSADGVLTTHCNANAFRVAQDLGLNLFWNEAAGRMMMANEMVDAMDANPTRFSKFQDHLAAWRSANAGQLVFAAQKEAGHGHIVPIYPSVGMETSGKWRVQVPVGSNVGIVNKIQGINFCFANPPDYYMVLDA